MSAFDAMAKPKPDDRLVKDVIVDMTPAQKDEWILDLAKQVHRDMDAKGLGMTGDDAGRLDVRFDATKKSGYDPDNHAITVHPLDFNMLTVGDLKVALAHELRHRQQNMQFGPDYIEAHGRWAEQDADLTAAKTYGPQAVVNLLERLSRVEEHCGDIYVSPNGKRLNTIPDEAHGTNRSRQEFVIKSFPHEHVHMPLPPLPRDYLPGILSTSHGNTALTPAFKKEMASCKQKTVVITLGHPAQ